MKSVFIDALPLRYRFTGSGQFCFHLIDELGRLAASDFEIAAYTREQDSKWLPPSRTIRFEPASWARRHAPSILFSRLLPHYDLWHLTDENKVDVQVPHNSKLVLTLHGLHFLDEFTASEIMIRKVKLAALVHRADAVVVSSNYTGKVLQREFEVESQKLHRIYLGTHLSSGETKPDSIPRSKFLFTLGTFFERKNYDSLLPFIQLLPEFTLVIAGEKSTFYGKAFEAKVQQMGLQSQVILPGEILEEEKNWYYKNCEAFVFPSLSEGFGIPVIEAMNFGKPVFLSTQRCLPEIGGQYAYYWENFEANAMKEVFEMGMLSEKLMGDERKTQRIKYAQSFSWKKTAQEYLKVYEQVLG